MSSLQRDPLLAERDQTAQDGSWSGADHRADLGAGDREMFRASGRSEQAISYCGLCGEEKSSADKVMRTPLSKQRNKHIQTGTGGSREAGAQTGP